MDVLINKQLKISGKKFYDTFADDIYDMIRNGYNENILHNPRLVMYKLLGQTKNGITITKKFDKKIGAAIAVMKYKGLIKNHWTIDTTRKITNYTYFDDVDEAMHYYSQWYHLDRWKDQPQKIMLMCEASGYLGVMKNIADTFRMPYVAAKGDMSIQLKLDIASKLTDDHIILYFGDYDDAGLRIPQTIENDMRTISGTNFTLVRMFINPNHIAQYDLDMDSSGSVQMEQFPTYIAIEKTKELIWSHIDKSKWGETVALEEEHKKVIKE